MKKSQASSASNMTRSSLTPECSNSSSSRSRSSSTSRTNNSNYSSDSGAQNSSPYYIKQVQRKIREVGRTVSRQSSSSSSRLYGGSSTLTGMAGSCFSQQSAPTKPRQLNKSENNSTPGSGGRCSKKDACGSAAIYAAKPKARPAVRHKKPAAAAAKAANLMSACADATAKQAERLRATGRRGCQGDNPYASLKTDTFRRLLAKTGGQRRRGRRHLRTGAPAAGGGGGGRKIKWCEPKTDECDAVQTQLCPNLGAGHTHGMLLEEVTPLMLRATQSLHCQLKELCRRLFFMRHNVPQLTAPALVNFHAILAEIVRMLLTDFASFPAGLKLPDRAE
ncbi:hypothetical protein BOX15_Mlig003887g1 [Macrostomum lignano]|uniref:Uncharacterized protein n=1 Tax=Macrostomum lignano TaxID=282301 RepID=A0A267EIG4_9PLAT|nr:hypothetical protein BOX15_Mlig003887g1 [Macrostomum lignano]